jgi:hypothetical protein
LRAEQAVEDDSSRYCQQRGLKRDAEMPPAKQRADHRHPQDIQHVILTCRADRLLSWFHDGDFGLPGDSPAVGELA